jgi:hypothetical protein
MFRCRLKRVDEKAVREFDLFRSFKSWVLMMTSGGVELLFKLGPGDGPVSGEYEGSIQILHLLPADPV